MDITLKMKPVVPDVNGKAEPKKNYTNTYLPFPADGFSKDLKHFQGTFIPDTVDWAATKEQPFAASSYPDFQPTIEQIWSQDFSAYTFTEAVKFLTPCRLWATFWESDIGKRALQVVIDHLNALPDIAARRKSVNDMSHNLALLDRDPKTQLPQYATSPEDDDIAGLSGSAAAGSDVP
ncbi:hypothetical protein B0H19DRAFT_1237302 [Mycena capillaripes]|nr:hypothetical protein B0H19DRAFT_1237302 [Mycena capillaripes]